VLLLRPVPLRFSSGAHRISLTLVASNQGSKKAKNRAQIGKHEVQASQANQSKKAKSKAKQSKSSTQSEPRKLNARRVWQASEPASKHTQQLAQAQQPKQAKQEQQIMHSKQLEKPSKDRKPS